jgi:hypothetical protein
LISKSAFCNICWALILSTCLLALWDLGIYSPFYWMKIIRFNSWLKTDIWVKVSDKKKKISRTLLMKFPSMYYTLIWFDAQQFQFFIYKYNMLQCKVETKLNHVDWVQNKGSLNYKQNRIERLIKFHFIFSHYTSKRGFASSYFSHFNFTSSSSTSGTLKQFFILARVSLSSIFTAKVNK